MRFFICSFLIIALIGCAHPTTRVQTVDDRPLLSINGAPATARVYVDGLNMGNASSFTDDNYALRLEPGTHLIEIRDESQTYFSDRVYLGSGSNRTINLGTATK